MIKIYLINTSAADLADAYPRILPMLGQVRRDKIGRLASSDDKMRSLGAGILLEVMLADCGIGTSRYDHAADGDAPVTVIGEADALLIRPDGLTALSGIDCNTDANGKPYLRKLPYHFSLSHSGDYAMCAVSEHNVGCDIERIVRANTRVAERYFHPSEVSRIADSPDAAREFCRIWTMREALSKLDGRGLRSLTDARETDFSRESDEYMTHAGRVHAAVLETDGHIAAVLTGVTE